MKNRTFAASLKYALNGIKIVIREERNFRFDIVMTLLVIIASFIFPLIKWERSVIFMLCALCLFAESMNSAMEKLVDLASPNFHPLAGQAKDIAAGASLICALCSAFVGLYIFLPYGIELLAKF